MNLWDTVTGNDLTRDWKAFQSRVDGLPTEYQDAWATITAELLPYGNFSGRNLTPIVDGVLGMLEESAAEGLAIADVVGADAAGFAAAVTGGSERASYRDRWRTQLNRNIARKLAKLEEGR